MIEESPFHRVLVLMLTGGVLAFAYTSIPVAEAACVDDLICYNQGCDQNGCVSIGPAGNADCPNYITKFRDQVCISNPGGAGGDPLGNTLISAFESCGSGVYADVACDYPCDDTLGGCCFIYHNRCLLEGPPEITILGYCDEGAIDLACVDPASRLCLVYRNGGCLGPWI
jgi:hypothetical protein